MGLRREIDVRGLAARVEALAGVPELRAAAAAAGVRAHLVGGSVRDLLLGAHRADLDVVVEGDHMVLARALGGGLRVHDRFGTATVTTAGGPVDVARARAERYEHPGALPQVRPADLRADLERRDFTVNAMAVALGRPGELIDPLGGLEDLRSGTLRALHGESFLDDPTRALRAARYASRLDLDPDRATLAGIREARLDTVSADRVEAELRRLATERRPSRGFELLSRWGLIALAPGADELIEAVAALLAAEPWRGYAGPADAVLAAARDETGSAASLAALDPARPSAAVDAARGHGASELALARAMGAAWLDRYLQNWRHVRLEIGGADLLAAGVPEGPAIGRGLAAALRAKLDGDAASRADELRIALAAAQ
jgi:tRNA nucleotidyltransferase (CCA-adding enzyme)